MLVEKKNEHVSENLPPFALNEGHVTVALTEMVVTFSTLVTVY